MCANKWLLSTCVHVVPRWPALGSEQQTTGAELFVSVTSRFTVRHGACAEPPLRSPRPKYPFFVVVVTNGPPSLGLLLLWFVCRIEDVESTRHRSR